MIQGGIATIYVSDMDRAVEFYTGVLGLKLENRYGNEWASIDAGGGFTLGLHPASSRHGAAEKRAVEAIEVGLGVQRPIGEVAAELKKRGVELQDVPEDPRAALRLVRFHDPDGNGLYLYAPW